MASGGGEMDGSVGLDVDVNVDVRIERAINGTMMTMMTIEGWAIGRMNGGVADVGTTTVGLRWRGGRQHLL
jgi:hypothetical protein